MEGAFLVEGAFEKFYLNQLHGLFYKEIDKLYNSNNYCFEKSEDKYNSIVDIVDECFFKLKSNYANHSKILSMINYYANLSHDILTEKWVNINKKKENEDEIDGIKEELEDFFYKVVKKVLKVCAELILNEIENQF